MRDYKPARCTRDKFIAENEMSSARTKWELGRGIRAGRVRVRPLRLYIF